MLGCRTTADASALCGIGLRGNNHSRGHSSSHQTAIRLRRNSGIATAAPSIANTNDNPHTPVYGASRRGNSIPLPALPSSSHSNAV